jgi:hypothetical protein
MDGYGKAVHIVRSVYEVRQGGSVFAAGTVEAHEKLGHAWKRKSSEEDRRPAR